MSPEERLDVPGLDKFVAPSLYTCHGPCEYPFETDSLAQVSHQAYCSEKHGTSSTTGVTYWTCNGNTTCDRSDEHWRVCGGSCGQKFAPRRINRGQGNYDYVANSPHYVTCSESTCNRKYYTCENSTCPDSSTHSSSSSSPGCSQHRDYDYCDDQGSCSTGSGSGVPGPICGHNHCCCLGSSSSSTSSSSDDSDSDNTPDCSYCTDGCSSCQSSSDDDSSSSSSTAGLDNTPDCDVCSVGCSSCGSEPTYDPGCGHTFDSYEAYEANPGNCMTYGCTLTDCSEIYWGCQGSHTSYNSCGSCGAGYSTCENVSPAYCYACGESL